MPVGYYSDGSSYHPFTPDIVDALGSSFNNMSYHTLNTPTTDWNKLSAGLYYVSQINAFSKDYHQPVGAYTYGLLIVFSNNGNNSTQVYIAHNNSQLWFRQRWSSSNLFTSWAKVITNLDIANQTVTASTTAAKLGRNGDVGIPMLFNWAGKDGQPTCLWGGEDGSNMYVYNPSNFNVATSKKADASYKTWCTTHPDTWYLESSWDGTYFQVRAHDTGSATLPVNVQKSNYSDSSGTANYCNNERSVIISSTQPTDNNCKIWVRI